MFNKKLNLFSILFFFISQHQCNTEKERYLKCIEAFCLPHDYSSSTMPRARNSTMEVKLEFSDVDILDVSDLKHTITMVMHLGVHWNEPRLVCPQNISQPNKVPLDLQFLDHLWLPDLDIYNIKQVKEFKILKKLAGKAITNYAM